MTLNLSEGTNLSPQVVESAHHLAGVISLCKWLHFLPLVVKDTITLIKKNLSQHNSLAAIRCKLR